jgi:hypothetical protein
VLDPGQRNGDAAQESQQFQDGDRDQPGLGPNRGSCWRYGGLLRREVDAGEQVDRDPAVLGPPADDLPGVQAVHLLAELVIFSDFT